MKNLVVGILAHVDAGKTTLSESMLYLGGTIRRPGRVDNQDAFLDNHALERARGITIFSKQARIRAGDLTLTLLDTPGHVDFSAEMERTLQVLDYAILVISGADGVQGHTETLWRLLSRYRIPTFLFVNKMDQPGTDRANLLLELKTRLDSACMDFDPSGSREEWLENLAVCEEELLDSYLETGTVEDREIVRLIAERKVFPCYFGSALKLLGVREFLGGLEHYTAAPFYGKEFGAKVYKIARDDQGTRLTYLKVTGGTLKVKAALTGHTRPDAGKSPEQWEEKVNQIRLYSGIRFETVNEAPAGTVCAVTGLSETYPGEGLGAEQPSELPVLEPVLSYRLILPPECDTHQMLGKLRMLEEEEPQLHITWDDHLGEIHAQLMGEVQTEILKSLILERFGVSVEFGPGNIVYKETIAAPVEGVGHFEPLRHYAEVHLLLEPGEPGSGLVFSTVCSEDTLDRSWQRLILTHLEEKEHRGVLTGSAVTDMKITLLAGRAHLKHTEGGDFRQATYRAVRQGLKKAEGVLLEPYYDFRLEVPAENIGRALNDVQKMSGDFNPPIMEGEFSILTGTVPAACIQDYQNQVVAYTKGRGRLSCVLRGYAPCHNADDVIASIGYDSERDLENPTGSVFCAHGAGFPVSWDQVEDYMHVHTELDMASGQEEETKKETSAPARIQSVSWQNDKELEEIFTRTYGQSKREKARSAPLMGSPKPPAVTKELKAREPLEEYLLVDGYNIIFAWEDLKALSETSIDGARAKLMDLLCNYQGYKKCTLILVFDAYKVQGHAEEILKYHNIFVVYTKEAETADQYIEKTAHAIGRRAAVTVATSDGLEQVIILGQGCRRLSAKGLREEMEAAMKEMRSGYLDREQNAKNYLFQDAEEGLADYLEDVRLGKKKL